MRYKNRQFLNYLAIARKQFLLHETGSYKNRIIGKDIMLTFEDCIELVSKK